MKLDLTTQAVLYTKIDGLYAVVTWAITNNTTVLFIDTQAHQGRDRQKGKGSGKATY